MNIIFAIYLLSFVICLFFGKKADNNDPIYQQAVRMVNETYHEEIRLADFISYMIPIFNTVKAIRTLFVLSNLKK